MARGSVEIFIDLSKYGNELAAAMAQRVCSEIVIAAQELVRVRTRDLQNSIKTIGVTRYHFMAVAETPYAAAQEWGRPDLPKYGFTPYMTPAAQEVSQPGNIQKLTNESVESAKLKAQARQRKGL
jgi:hypothetical protein